MVLFYKKKVTIEAEAKYSKDVYDYIRDLLEELSGQAFLEFKYDDKTARYIRTIIRDSKTNVS